MIPELFVELMLTVFGFFLTTRMVTAWLMHARVGNTRTLSFQIALGFGIVCLLVGIITFGGTLIVLATQK